MVATMAVDRSTTVVWIMLGCMIITMGVGGNYALRGRCGGLLATLISRALLAVGCDNARIAASTRFAAWVLLFGWIVMFLWALAVALATGLDILLIPPALLYSIVPVVAFLGQQPRSHAQT
jgi:hypothetical protein